MNRRPPGLLISKAIPGFIQFKTAEGLSPRTIDSYKRILEQWLEFLDDIDVGNVTTQQIREYLNSMRIKYVPNWLTGNNDQKLSSKRIRILSYVRFFIGRRMSSKLLTQ